jgi:hypothetical protein
MGVELLERRNAPIQTRINSCAALKLPYCGAKCASKGRSEKLICRVDYFQPSFLLMGVTKLGDFVDFDASFHH